MTDKLPRRKFLELTGCSIGLSGLVQCGANQAPRLPTPNVILCMADDLGWGDVRSNGHPRLETPYLDQMASNGIHFSRFYSGAPLCSPTRGSCLTGRHPYRYGIYSANVGHLPPEEITLAEILKSEGYATGHFGKWHLGTLTTKLEESNRGGPRGIDHFSPPWENGFETCFSTEAKVPTWDPMVSPEVPIRGVDINKAGQHYGTHYWNGPEARENENLEGDDSRVIMDRAISFIETAAAQGRPFFAVIWFHTPHTPVVAGPRYLEQYPGLPEEERHYYGCITAMDEQIGRLRDSLKRLGVSRNTMLWFCSDNGPEGDGIEGRSRGSTGPFRGRKRSLLEGGVRVPAFLEWPARIPEGRSVDVPCVTSDYLPTILEALGHQVDAHPLQLDGLSLIPLIDGLVADRASPIGFQSAQQVSLVSNRYKLYSADQGSTFALYDLIADTGETKDLSSQKLEVVVEMRQELEGWLASCRNSLGGGDY